MDIGELFYCADGSPEAEMLADLTRRHGTLDPRAVLMHSADLHGCSLAWQFSLCVARSVASRPQHVLWLVCTPPGAGGAGADAALGESLILFEGADVQFADVAVLERINLKYFTDRQQLGRFLSHVHRYSAEAPALVIVQGLSLYFAQHDSSTSEQLARTMALLADALDYFSAARRTEGAAESCRLLLVESIAGAGFTSSASVLAHASLLEHWCPTILAIRSIDSPGGMFELLVQAARHAVGLAEMKVRFQRTVQTDGRSTLLRCCLAPLASIGEA